MLAEQAEHPTLLDKTPNGADTHNEGWLTAEAYLAWISGTCEVRLDEQPFVQPSVEGFLPFALEDEDIEVAA